MKALLPMNEREGLEGLQMGIRVDTAVDNTLEDYAPPTALVRRVPMVEKAILDSERSQEGVSGWVTTEEVRTGNEPPTVKPVGSKPALTHGGTETILLVDDEPGVLRAAKMLLERSGYRILVAADGLEALEIFQGHHAEIDLLLTDVVMPRMSGFEAAEKILEIKTVPVLFCSGYTASALKKELRIPAGAQILQKPYAPALLRSTVRDLLNSTQVLE